MKQSFEQWKSKVNQIIEDIIGLSADDLPDWDYWSAWDSGVTPASAAKEVLRESLDF